MLDVIYKDKDIVICIKPIGVDSEDKPGGMPELIKNELGFEGTVYVVHRLDKQVSGLMVYALNTKAAANLSKQIQDKTFNKRYLAVIHGTMDEKEGRLDDFLFKDSSKNTSYVVKRMRKGVKEASLLYKVEGETESLSLVNVLLLTGRTHQIRVQFSSRKHVLYGDKKYGAASDNADIALWSYSLEFKHPYTGEDLIFTKMPENVYPWSLFNNFNSQQLITKVTSLKELEVD